MVSIMHLLGFLHFQIYSKLRGCPTVANYFPMAKKPNGCSKPLSPRAWPGFESPPQLEKREIAIILLRRSALDVGGSPLGCWAAAQLLLLSECFVFCGAGIFFRSMGTLCWAGAGSRSCSTAQGGLCRCYLRKKSSPQGGDPPIIPSEPPVCWGED